MNELSAFGGFFITLLVYLVAAKKAVRTPPKSPAEYFLAAQSHTSGEYGNSTTSYALQMATVYPFFCFAYSGEWFLVAWNTLFFAVGIVLLYITMPRVLRNGQVLIKGNYSLHGFIAAMHRAPGLRKLTAWMSIIGFSGLALFEIVWGAKVLKVLFGDFDTANTVYYFSILVLAMYLITYLRMGGQSAVMKTDQVQLVIGYLGIHALVLWVAVDPSVDLSSIGVPILVPAVFIFSIPMWLERAGRIRTETGRLNKTYSTLILISLSALLAALAIQDNFFSMKRSWSLGHIDLTKVEDGYLKLLGFALLPLFFQFADMTTWQRMAAVGDDRVYLTKSIQKGLRQYFMESPLSWLFPVLLGLCAVQILGSTGADIDPWDAFLKAAMGESGVLGAMLAALVAGGIGAIFLSTADSLLNAVGYSYAYDINRRSRGFLDVNGTKTMKDRQNRVVLRTGKNAMTAALTLIVVAFFLVDWCGESLGLLDEGASMILITLFLSFFSPMISFAPAVVVPGLTGKAASAKTAKYAILSGGGCGVAIGIASVFFGGWLQWVSIVVAFSTSWIVYLVGFGIKRKELPSS